MTRLVTLLVFLFIGLASVRADDMPACTGVDLLAKMKREDPAAYDAVMAEARAVPNHEALLWKIERGDIAPSHLLGTAHVTDPRVTTLSPEIKEALFHADNLALELEEIASRERSAKAAFGLARYMVMPPGQTLWDLIPDDQETLVRDNLNLAPGAANGFFGYQPWVVAMALGMPLCESSRAKSGLMPLDMKLAVEATAKGIPVHGLETMEEQFSIIAAMPMDQQLDYLMAVARNAAAVPDQFETLVSLYQQRLVTAMIPMMLKIQPLKTGEAEVLEYVERDLIVKRNHKMAERALPLLEEGNVFIAVGALHLPGRQGLVELLRQAGYKLTPIN